MAVVPDKVSLYEHKLSTLKTNRSIVLEALQQVIQLLLIGVFEHNNSLQSFMSCFARLL